MWETGAHVTARLYTQFHSHFQFRFIVWTHNTTHTHSSTRTCYSHTLLTLATRTRSICVYAVLLACVKHGTRERHASALNITREWHSCPLHTFVNFRLDVTVSPPTSCWYIPSGFSIEIFADICNNYDYPLIYLHQTSSLQQPVRDTISHKQKKL